MTEATRNLVFAAIRDRAILRSSEQRLVSPAGGNNNWLIDLRRIFMDAALLDALANEFWRVYGDKLPFQVGGMEVAAIPLLAAILMKSVARGTPVNGFIIRKERKQYGVGNFIEGDITDRPIIIVDDIMNSGGSLEKIRVILELEAKAISSIFVVIDYCSRRGDAWRTKHGFPVISIFRLADFGLALRKPEREPLPSLFQNLWCFVSPDPNFYDRVPKSFPVTDDSYIYFGSDCGIFWCLDALDGSVIWTFSVSTRGHKNIWSAPALNGGRVFFGAYDGNVYCLDARTGEEIWRFTGADWVGSSPAIAADLDLLFIGLEFDVEGKRGSIVALSLTTGQKVWEHKTKRFTHASPAYWAERKVVACGSNDNELFLFDATTGRLRWRFETKGDDRKGSIRHAPAFDKLRGLVVTGCADGYIYVVNVDTGDLVWSLKTENTIYTIPLVLDSVAYIGSTDKYFYVIDLTRLNIKQKLYVGAKIFAPPRLINRSVYFGATNGIIYELNIETLEITGTHQLGDAITNAITHSPSTGIFYALTYTNQLYAMKHMR